MAQLTLTLLTTEVQDYIPGKPMAQVGRAANQVLREIGREINEIDRSTLTTRAPYSTGTVAVTQGATSVVLTTGTWSTTWGPKVLIQIDGDETWYTLTITGAAAGTLSSGWAPATVAAATYQMAFPYVALGSSVLIPFKFRITGGDPMRYVHDEMYRERLNNLEPGQPLYWAPSKVGNATSPNDGFEVMFLPPPDDEYAITYVYKMSPSAYTTSDGSSLSGLPDIFNDAILAGTLSYLWDQEDKQDRSGYWRGRYELALMRARAEWSSMAEMTPDDFNDEGGLWVRETRPVG